MRKLRTGNDLADHRGLSDRLENNADETADKHDDCEQAKAARRARQRLRA